tara:strand:+ start:863 stop:1126 length:264 start_codon:yes stop_codon:yes gene_type:complete
MAKYSHKMMGNEVGAASVYAEPHTMSGKPVKLSSNPGSEPNGSKADSVNMSVGNIYKRDDAGPKTSGIVVRGGKAQTKGKMARGPMA